MWHTIRIPGPHLSSALESGDILDSMADRLNKELLATHQQIAALRAAGVGGQLTQSSVEMYARHEADGSEVLYLNDAALQLYRDVGGTRPVEQTMEQRPPDEHEDDILRAEALLLRHTRLRLRLS